MSRSQTFPMFRALVRMLEDEDWPRWPESSAVGVWLGDPFHAPAGVAPSDVSVVVATVVDMPAQDWATIGTFARDETFAIPVVASVVTPGLSAVEVLGRLEELAAQITDVILRAATVEGRPREVAAHVWKIGVSRVRPLVWATDEGYFGQVEVPVGVAARI